MSKLALPRAQTSKTSRVFIGDATKGDGSGLTGLTFNSGQIATPTGTPTVAVPAGAGNVDIGSHVYAVAFTTANGGETPAGPNSAAATTSAGNQQVSLTAIPTGPASTTGRKIYRSKAGTTTPLFLVATLADNSTTTYTDNLADASLGAGPQTVNTTGLYLAYHREGDASATPIQLVAGTVGTYLSASFAEISARYMRGWYEVGIPDAMFASGPACVATLCNGPNMVSVQIEFDLGMDHAVLEQPNMLQTGLNALGALRSMFDGIYSGILNAGTANPSVTKSGATIGAAGGARSTMTTDAAGNRSAITVDPN